MAKIAVVYHSGYGHTKVQAEAVARGAAEVKGTEVELISVADLPAPDKDRKLGGKWPALDAADALIFGCPTYMGSVSAEMKTFMERSSGIWMRQGWKDKLAGGFSNSGGLSGDKLNTLLDIVVFAGQHSMVWVSQGIMAGTKDEQGRTLNRVGSWLGAFAQSDNGPATETPGADDKRTAELYGKRVAEAAARWKAGKA